jgi:hypothetical protein
MLGTATVMYPSLATSMSTIGASIAINGTEDGKWKVSYDLIRKGVRKLVRNRAKKNTSIVTGSTKVGTVPVAKAFYAIINADVKSDLESLVRGTVADNGTTEFVYVPAHKYAGAGSLAEGEVGQMHEVKFIEAESAVVYAAEGAAVPANYAGTLSYSNDGVSRTVTNISGAELTLTLNSGETYASTVVLAIGASANILDADVITGGTVDVDYTILNGDRFDVYPILFPTEGAFATVGLKGHDKIKFNSKSPEQVENGNPYGTTGFFSYNFFYAGIILREEALLKILVAASA